MGKIVKVPIVPPVKKGARKARKSKRAIMEEMGQLNLFDQLKIVPFPKAENFFEQALLLDDSGDPRAIEFYLKAVETHESTADAYCNLGILMWQQKEMAKAVDYLTRCLKVNPRHYEAHYNLANVYSEWGNPDIAIIHYSVAIQIEPDFPNSYYNLGLVYIGLEQYEEAISFIRKYMAMAPESDRQEADQLIKSLRSVRP